MRFKIFILRGSMAFVKAMLWELKHVFKDRAVLFSFVGSAVLVAFLYAHIYAQEVLHNLPVAVVDNDHTAQSRQLLQMIDASEKVSLVGDFSSLNEAKQAFEKDEVRGVVVIPHRFAADLQKGEQPSVSVYADTAYMLYYKQILTAVKTAVGYLNTGVQLKKASAKGKIPLEARNETIATQAQIIGLYNPSIGYATFIMPVVLVIIFQTTMLTAMGILGGKLKENDSFDKLFPDSRTFFDMFPIVMGKATAYLIVAIMVLLLMLWVVMPLYDIPMRGSTLEIIVFMVPFLLSVCFLGIILLSFFNKREDAILFIMFTSIPSLLLTGFSVPVEMLPEAFKVLSLLVPTTTGVRGFVSLTQMGASLKTIIPIWWNMWQLCVGYLTVACAFLYFIYIKPKKQKHIAN